MQFLFRQTRTSVHSPLAQRQERERGLASASRAAAAIQIGAQLILWIFFFAYDRSAQTVWQAALMLIVPLAGLWLAWRKADTDHSQARWWLLLLVPCLLLDSVFLTAALGGFISQLVPNYPAWATTLIPSACCAITALRARPRGVKYGSLLLAVPLMVLLIFGTVFLRASTRADRLWPIWGDGILSTAGTALTGAGAVWGVSLLFLRPPARRAAAWAAAPWMLGVLCALWFGFLKPWSPGDTLPVAEKMMGLARHARSVILYEISGVMWMLLIPAALSACFSTAGELLTGAFPRLKEWMALPLLPALAISAVLLWPDSVLTVLGAVLPWRFVPAILCGLMISIRRTR